MLFRMAASPAHISSHVVWSRPHTSESRSRHDPPILSILILHSLMDLVAAAQLIFPMVCTDASLLSNCFANVTEMLLCCSAFASLDQKSPVERTHIRYLWWPGVLGLSVINKHLAHLRLRHLTSIVQFAQFIQQKGRITNRPKCGLPCQQDFLNHVLMSHASLGM